MEAMQPSSSRAGMMTESKLSDESRGSARRPFGKRVAGDEFTGDLWRVGEEDQKTWRLRDRGPRD